MNRTWKALLAVVPAAAVAAALAGGVPAAAGDGRYKVGSKGECYWDASDTGPNQCEPPAGQPR